MIFGRNVLSSEDLNLATIRRVAMKQLFPKLVRRFSLASACVEPARTPMIHGTGPLWKRSFTISATDYSHIGRAPLTIPPNVDFQLFNFPEPQPTSQPSSSASRARRRREQIIQTTRRSTANQPPLVRVRGPLGELGLNVPEFVRIQHDEQMRKATLAILDSRDKMQKAHWGQCASLWLMMRPS